MKTTGYGTDAGDRPLCLECGEEMGYGRENRKFCSQKCKNSFHNRRLRHSRAVKARVQNALEKNYSILERLLQDGVESMPLCDLKDCGFNMDYFTSYAKTRRHDEFACFDIRFTVMSSSVISIRRSGFAGGPPQTKGNAARRAGHDTGDKTPDESDNL